MGTFVGTDYQDDDEDDEGYDLRSRELDAVFQGLIMPGP